MSARAQAVRDLLGNPVWGGGGSWATEHAPLPAVGSPVVLAVVFFTLSVRCYRALGR